MLPQKLPQVKLYDRRIKSTISLSSHSPYTPYTQARVHTDTWRENGRRMETDGTDGNTRKEKSSYRASMLTLTCVQQLKL